MTENWRKCRKAIRDKELDNRIYKMTLESGKSEEIIRHIEEPGITVFGKSESMKSEDGRTLRTKGVSMYSPNGNIDVVVGVPIGGNRKDVVSVDISVADEARWFNDSDSNKDEFSFVLENENALDEAVALFRGVYLLLKQHKREIEKPNRAAGGAV